MHVLFVEDGKMEKRVFLATWKDIPSSNEIQHNIHGVQHSAGIGYMHSVCKAVSSFTPSFSMLIFVDTLTSILDNNNVFTIAKRNVEGQDMLYLSLKLTNGIWVLCELKIQPANTTITVSLIFGT